MLFTLDKVVAKLIRQLYGCAVDKQVCCMLLQLHAQHKSRSAPRPRARARACVPTLRAQRITRLLAPVPPHSPRAGPPASPAALSSLALARSVAACKACGGSAAALEGVYREQVCELLRRNKDPMLFRFEFCAPSTGLRPPVTDKRDPLLLPWLPRPAPFVPSSSRVAGKRQAPH